MSLAELFACDFEAPRSLDALLSLLAARSAAGEATVLLAGGTDWLVERHLAPPSLPAPPSLKSPQSPQSLQSRQSSQYRPSPVAPRPLVADVSRLAELRGVAVRGDVLDLGAAATYLEISREPAVRTRCPLLAAACRDVGAVQIQARGTLGGNLATASPAADGVAALASLDSTLVLASAQGTRRVPLSGFYTGYKRSVLAADEAILRIEVTLPPEGARWSWRKVGTRQAQSISKVALAAVADLEGTGPGAVVKRLGLGMASVAPMVSFLPTVRALAEGRSLTALASLPVSAIDAAVDADIAPIDDIRSTAAYRRHVARALVRNFLATL